MKTPIIYVILLLAAVTFAQDRENPGDVEPPQAGYVPNQETAVKIAEAVLIPIYGEKLVKNERPFHAKLRDEVWTVSGTLHCPKRELCVGGSAVVQLSKRDGRILEVVHYK